MIFDNIQMGALYQFHIWNNEYNDMGEKIEPSYYTKMIKIQRNDDIPINIPLYILEQSVLALKNGGIVE